MTATVSDTHGDEDLEPRDHVVVRAVRRVHRRLHATGTIFLVLLVILVAVAVLNTAISAFYYLRWMRTMWMDEPVEATQFRPSGAVQAVLAAAAPVLVALLGSLAVLWVGIARGLAPLAHIRAALAERSADSVEPLQIDGLPAELTPLVETQNLLFQRIADTIQRERRLTDNVAHELRSPLTAIKTHLQVASMTAGETARHAVEQAEIGTVCIAPLNNCLCWRGWRAWTPLKTACPALQLR